MCQEDRLSIKRDPFCYIYEYNIIIFTHTLAKLPENKVNEHLGFISGNN